MNKCAIQGMHCEQCGSTDVEDIGFTAVQENDGYSACCNEIISWGPEGCRAHHVEEGTN